MGLLSQAVRPFSGGVSQAPELLRPQGRVTSQDNAWSHPVLGLMKRPPTSLVSQIVSPGGAPTSAALHFIEKSADEKYLVMLDGSTVKVWNALTGAAVSVVLDSGTSYVTSASPEDDLRLLTVGDTTYIVNRSRVTAPGTTKAPAQVNEALVFVRQVDYSTQFTVTLNGIDTVYQTVAQGAAAGSFAISSDNVAADLITVMKSNPQLSADFAFTQYGSSIYIQRADGADFALSTSDGLADKGLKAIKGSIQSIADLPERAKAGMILQVVGDPGSPVDDFWVVYEDSETADQAGVWRETAAPGSITSYSTGTLPVALRLNGTLVKDLTAGKAPPAPWVRPTFVTRHVAGFTSDPDTGTPYDGNTNLPITTHGAGFQGTPLGLDGGRKRIRVPYDLDTSLIEQGETVEVQLLANTGAGFTKVASNLHRPGAFGGTTHELRVDAAWAASTPIQVRAYYGTAGTPSQTSRQVQVMLRRANIPTDAGDGLGGISKGSTDTPGIVTEASTTQSVVFSTTRTYPATTSITLNLATADSAEQDSFTYTVPLGAPVTGAAIAAAFNSAITTKHATTGFFTSTVSSNTLSISPGSGSVGVDVNVTITLPGTTLYVPGVNFSGRSGQTLRNVSDGSSGTITSAGQDYVTVSALVGGVANTIAPSDACEILAGAGSFVLQALTWEDRSVGSADSNPWPSFIGHSISAPVFYGNRLGFISGSNVVLSAAGDYSRFTRRTVTDLLADDPIDVALASTRAADFERATVWDDKLCLITSSGVYTLTGEPALTPSTVRLDVAAEVHVETTTAPAVIGSRLVFAQPAGAYSRLLEVFVDPYSRSLQSDDITKEVPRYISGSAKQITGSFGHGILVASTGDSSVYAFSFAFSQEGAVLTAPTRSFAAWQRWTFAGDVKLAQVSGEWLYLVMFYGDGSCSLERLPISDFSGIASYSDAGAHPYTASIRLSRPYVRDSQGGAVAQGRVQARYLHVNHTAGSAYNVTVTPAVGAARITPQAAAAQDGDLHVPVLGRNTEITVDISSSDPSTPMVLTALEWELFYTSRSRPQ